MNRWTRTLGIASTSALAALLGLHIAAVPATAADCTLASVRCVDDTAGPTQEYATIQAAVNAAQPGETVQVHDGTYAGFVTVRDGTAASPILIQAAGANALVNSPGNGAGDNINIENTDYVIVDGLRVANAGRTGIRVVNSRGVIVRNNTITNSGMWGILTGFAVDLQILNNSSSGAIGEHGIYVSNSTSPADNPVVRGNVVFNNSFNGIQFNGDCFLGGDGIISGAVIENNRVYGNGYKGFSLISLHDSLIQNNVIFGNGQRNGGAGGIHLADEPGCNDNSDNNVVVNNTIREPIITGIRISQGAGNVIFNNIAVSAKPIVDEIGGNFIDGASNVQLTSSTGLFVNEAGGDYHLAAGSTAIDRGRASYTAKSAPAVDFDGNSRPQGTAHDSGAYESGSGTPDTTPPSVTVNQAAGQADPASGSTINFTAVFSEPVNGFTASDVVISGTAPGTKTVVLTPSGNSYNIAVSGMSGAGTVIASIPAGAAADAAGNPSNASTSTDSVVTFQQPVVITTTTLPDGKVGTAYNAPLTAAGGTAPYSWALVSGSLPRGLSMSPTGAITGTPSRKQTTSFTVRATSANGLTATKVLSIRINR